MKNTKRPNNFEAYLGTDMNLILTKMKNEGKDGINLGLGDIDIFVLPLPIQLGDLRKPWKG